MFTQLILVNLILASSSASRHDRSIINNRRLNSGQEMVWTDFEPEIPDHCRDQGLCEDVPNYPHEYIDHLLRYNATVRNALSFALGAYETDSGCKDGADPKIHELCASETKLFQAKAAQDVNGRWYHLLAKPFICLEVCKHADSPCSNKTMKVYTGYTSICKQKITKKRMVAVGANGVVRYIDVDKIFTGCCCQVTEN